MNNLNNTLLIAPKLMQADSSGVINIEDMKSTEQKFIVMEVNRYLDFQVGDEIIGYLRNNNNDEIKSIPNVIVPDDEGNFSVLIYFHIEDIKHLGHWNASYEVTKLNSEKLTSNATDVNFRIAGHCPPEDNIYNINIFYFSSSDEGYIFRQRQCDKVVSVNKISPDGVQGEDISEGQQWDHFYDILLPFKLGNQQYVFGLKKNVINAPQIVPKSYWMIAKLSNHGFRDVVDSGHWDNPYDVGFTYAIDNKQFIYLHSSNKDKDGKYPYIIREIKQDGSIGGITTSDHWDHFYAPTFSFSTKDKVYFYGQTKADYSLVNYGLKPDGTIGEPIKSGPWLEYNAVQVTFSLGGYNYYAGQDFDSHGFWIASLSGNGLPYQNAVMNKVLDKNYQYLVPFEIKGKHYFLMQDQSKEHWVIHELKDDNTFGKTTDQR
ncbi:hypothetical protein Xmau_03393 [Xenorhabdus mauleonii]|uniref:Uncharacterized protein n=1 Tax=Xenorhabdus mauleonii TaxID=351675 RepID=A0A1I3R088_9GAMM|nr:hypothetical protein [Xenorhabdus mauleonii]PHM38683.1 hypothetical protein Xmau_03393 [Xenorhabdus mauleonii]SFJ38706.1 hypothetical protein SAMN05421680_10866 [Xenorhabdus mauleonii]